jgi:serine/threonine protein kinase
MAKAQKPYQGGSSSLADFKQLSLLGEGAYSAVYKVLRLADRELYALKKVKLPSLSDKEKQNALNEVRLLASIRHENVIAYKEAFFDDKTRCLCIVQEYADSGDLFHLITKSQKGRTHIPENDVWRFVHGMCHGLKALHDMRILHRDLKCANVFLHNRGNEVYAMLGDFNVSKVAKRGLCMTQTGTPYYASPEVWRDMPYDAKSDMWSIGCVLYEMVALRPPFRAEDMEGLYRKVLRGQYPRIPAHYSHDLSEIIGVLLQVNPRHRPSVDQLIQMPVMRRHTSESSLPESRATDLLQTIKLPKDAIDLSTCLPKPQYDLDFGSYDISEVPHSQESAGDVAGGTRARRGMPPISSGRGALGQLPHPPSLDESRGGADSYQDSLDAYLSPQGQGGQDNVSQMGTATIDAPRHVPARGRDSLDEYLQQEQRPQKSRAPPAHPPRQQPLPSTSEEHQDPIAAAQQLRDSANPRALRNLARQEQQADYHGAGGGGYGGPHGGRGVPQPQYNAYPSLPAPVPRYGGDYGEDHRRASPAPSSHARRAPRGVYGERDQYRHARGEDRKPMASYARPQYAMGGAAAPQQVSRQQSAGGAGLRLPRIFTKG